MSGPEMRQVFLSGGSVGWYEGGIPSSSKRLDQLKFGTFKLQRHLAQTASAQSFEVALHTLKILDPSEDAVVVGSEEELDSFRSTSSLIPWLLHSTATEFYTDADRAILKQIDERFHKELYIAAYGQVKPGEEIERSIIELSPEAFDDEGGIPGTSFWQSNNRGAIKMLLGMKALMSSESYSYGDAVVDYRANQASLELPTEDDIVGLHYFLGRTSDKRPVGPVVFDSHGASQQPAELAPSTYRDKMMELFQAVEHEINFVCSNTGDPIIKNHLGEVVVARQEGGREAQEPRGDQTTRAVRDGVLAALQVRQEGPLKGVLKDINGVAYSPDFLKAALDIMLYTYAEVQAQEAA